MKPAAAIHVMPVGELADLFGYHKYPLELGSEIEGVILPAVEEGLDTEQVTGSKQVLSVEDSQREDSVIQIAERFLAIFLIKGKEQALFSKRPLFRFGATGNITGGQWRIAVTGAGYVIQEWG